MTDLPPIDGAPRSSPAPAAASARPPPATSRRAGSTSCSAHAGSTGCSRSPASAVSRVRQGARARRDRPGLGRAVRVAARAACRPGQQRRRREGMAPVAEADEEQWRWMYDANVLGVMRVTKALLPAAARLRQRAHRDHRLRRRRSRPTPKGAATPPRSTPCTRSARRCGRSCSAARSGSPRSRRAWSRRSSP